MATKQYQNVRGTFDILPADQARYRHIFETFRQVVTEAGFGYIDTPIMEMTGVFIRSVGDSTDIVEKEMYLLQDRGGDDLALRPESTAGVVRAYIQHGMGSWPKPREAGLWWPAFSLRAATSRSLSTIPTGRRRDLRGELAEFGRANYPTRHAVIRPPGNYWSNRADK